MRDDVKRWLASASSVADDWPLDTLLARKGDTTVSVVLPALNEGETVGTIVELIRASLMDDDTPLVNELVVLDSGSTDDTARRAESAGATVLHRDDVLPGFVPTVGKGEAMWRAVAATHGDIVVFIDADLRSFTPTYVSGLLGPLFANPDVQLVKAVYERPYVDGDTVVAAGGGRVTELVARPLLNLHWPELSGVIQPLAGEYAARRTLLERVSFPCGYGVELALLIDTLDLYGLDAIAQVDLGVRIHRHHDERKLGRMAAQIMRTAMVRLERSGRAQLHHELGTTLDQFERSAGGFTTKTHTVSGHERPPLIDVAEYAGAATGTRAERSPNSD
ncbi:MAG: glucosyl-3-phosphoglycerate synthase [Actinobacteria bacterium]|nr:glucosyl-3-phosphoglycerate synthase [Actinomycetota bacterium]